MYPDADANEVQLAKQGDSAIWTTWFDRYYDTLYRYAYVRLRNRQDAEDVASQVFLQGIKHIHSYRYTGRPILAWFYRIAGNLISDRLRRRAPVPDPAALEAVATPGLELHIDQIVLSGAVETLKPEQRDVVVLRLVLGLSIKEVAQILNKSEGAVHSLQVRATRSLRKNLSEFSSGR